MSKPCLGPAAIQEDRNSVIAPRMITSVLAPSISKSSQSFQGKPQKAKGIMLQILWVVKQGHIGDAFFDSDAADFLRGELDRSRAGAESASLEEQSSRQHGSHLAFDNWSDPVSVSVRKV